MPRLGMGTWMLGEHLSIYQQEKKALQAGIDAGFTLIDTAEMYGNGLSEKLIGDTIQGYSRENLFLVSKVYPHNAGRPQIYDSIDQTLHNLKTDYLDMYLIHWPLPNPEYKDWKELDIETWRGLEELYKAGKVKAIGVSNFLLHHLENLIQNCEIMPMADQIEFHPGFTQEATVRYCQEKGIYVQAWSPLGRKRVLEHPLLVGLAEKYNKSAAQICLRYEIQRQVIPLPKASTKERMVQNYQVFDFEIEKEDMYRIDSMQPAGWSGEHPDFPRVK